MKRIDFSKHIFKYKKVIFLSFLLLSAYGLFSYFTIPKEDMPEFTTPYATFIVTSYGHSAREIDEYIVKDIYSLSTSVEDILDLSAIAYDNYAVINYEFGYGGRNPDIVKEELSEIINDHAFSIKINDINLYEGFYEPLAVYALSGDSIDNLLLEADEMASEFLNIKGVKEAIITSNNSYQSIIDVDQDILDLYGLNFEYIYYKVNASLSEITLGNITNVNGSFMIESNDLINDVEDLNSIIIVANYDGLGSNLYLSDLSNISSINTSNKIYEANGEKAVFISLVSNDNIDITKLDKELDSVVNAHSEDLDIDIMLYTIDDVNRQLGSIFTNLLITLAIVLMVMVVGINLRISLINLFCTVVIVFGTIGILNFLGYSLEKLSVVGIIVSIGILVDNMVVIGEGISTNLENNMSIEEAVKKSIKKNSIPVLSSSLTTIAAFFSIALIGGFLGEVIKSMPVTVIIMISLSYIVSMTLLPLLSVLLFKKAKKKIKKERKNSVIFKKVIGLGMKFPLLILILSFISLGLFTYLVYNNQTVDLYPIDDKKGVYIDIVNSDSYSLSDTYSLYQDLESYLSNDDEIISYFSASGGDLPRFHFSSLAMNESTNVGRIYLSLDLPVSSLEKYRDNLQAELDLISDNYTVSSLELSPPENDLTVMLSSENLLDLESQSSTISSEIVNLDNIAYSKVLGNVIAPKYQIEYNTQKMSEELITREQIDQTIALHANGFYFDILGEKENIQIISTDYDIDLINSLLIKSDVTGLSSTLSDLATINQIFDYSLIRSNSEGYILEVLLDLDSDYDTSSLKDDINEISDNPLYEDIDFNYSGVNKMFDDIIGSIISASIISIIMIYIFMFIQFNSFIKPLIIYITIPLSFAGSLMFMLIFDSPISATSLIGIISLIGITVNTGILLVEYIDIEVKENGKDVFEACIEAVYKRFNAIVITSLTTVFGLVPLLINGGDFFSPLAITFMGGIFTSALLTIFLVPGIYHKIYKKRT